MMLKNFQVLLHLANIPLSKIELEGAAVYLQALASCVIFKTQIPGFWVLLSFKTASNWARLLKCVGRKDSETAV